MIGQYLPPFWAHLVEHSSAPAMLLHAFKRMNAQTKQRVVSAFPDGIAQEVIKELESDNDPAHLRLGTSVEWTNREAIAAYEVQSKLTVRRALQRTRRAA